MKVRAVSVSVTPDELEAGLGDGRTIAAPLAWFSRLLHGTAEERGAFRLIGQGEGLHWPELDEGCKRGGAACGAAVCRERGSLIALAGGPQRLRGRAMRKKKPDHIAQEDWDAVDTPPLTDGKCCEI